MPENRTRGRTGRRLALAIVVPAAAAAAVLTGASMATGATTAAEPAAPEAAATTTRSGTPGTTSPSTSPSGSPSATVPGLPGVPAPTGTIQVSCLRGTGTTSPAPGLSAPGVPGLPTTPRTGGPHTLPGTGGRTVPGTDGHSLPSGPKATQSHSTPSQPTGPGSQQVTPTTVRLGTAGGKANVLVDQNGCALYLNTQDTATSTAIAPNAEASFVPVLAPGQPGTGIQSGDLGTFQRPDGRNQVTYKGHQLYRFVGDTAPGQANGEGRDGVYFLVGENGNPVK